MTDDVPPRAAPGVHDLESGDGAYRANSVDAPVAATLRAAREQIIRAAAVTVGQRGGTHYRRDGASTKLRGLFSRLLESVESDDPDMLAAYCDHIAQERARAGFDLGEVQAAFASLEEAVWAHAISVFNRDAIGLAALLRALSAGRDALGRAYLEWARSGSPTEPGLGGAPVGLEVRDHVAILTLRDDSTRNALSARMTAGIDDALDRGASLGARAVVLRANPDATVWSSGHDINELPHGRRDPLGYNDPLEQCVRAIRSCRLPVIAMVHGSVWGAAFDLVLSCDVVVADETATFAITPANLGVPYNTTGLLHFLGRVPVNIVKEMFFTAAPIGAEQAERWLVVNHLVPSGQLEEFTLTLAATMATKAPLAIAAVKEQLRVLTDYQPVAAQVYERIQALRREAYDSADYLEGLAAFAERRPPTFNGV